MFNKSDLRFLFYMVMLYLFCALLSSCSTQKKASINSTGGRTSEGYIMKDTTNKIFHYNSIQKNNKKSYYLKQSKYYSRSRISGNLKFYNY